MTPTTERFMLMKSAVMAAREYMDATGCPVVSVRRDPHDLASGWFLTLPDDGLFCKEAEDCELGDECRFSRAAHFGQLGAEE